MRWYHLLVLALCVCKQVVAEPQKPKTLTFSYVRHPSILDRIIPLIRETYARIGIEVILVAQPSSRNLKLVSSGVVDGDVAFTASMAEGYENILVIYPRLSRGKFVVLCHKTVTCQENVLFDENKSVVVTDTSFDSIKKAYQDRLAAEFYPINRIDRIPELIAERRFDYGIYIFNIQTSTSPFSEASHFNTLYHSNTVHVLNDKYAFLEDKVSASLTKVLAEEAKENSLTP